MIIGLIWLTVVFYLAFFICIFKILICCQDYLLWKSIFRVSTEKNLIIWTISLLLGKSLLELSFPLQMGGSSTLSSSPLPLPVCCTYLYSHSVHFSFQLLAKDLKGIKFIYSLLITKTFSKIQSPTFSLERRVFWEAQK